VARAREVGISRSAAANWTRGYTVYRDGVAVRFVEPLDRLEVREISARYLSQQERIEIADLHHEGVGVREISRRVGPVAVNDLQGVEAQPDRWTTAWLPPI
jgi:transposase, IS30 family